MDGYTATTKKKPKSTLAARFEQLNAQRGDILTRCEDYAYWTLPGVFPKLNTKQTEQRQMANSIGARCVNHLANKLITTMFPAGQPFFRLKVRDDDINKIATIARTGDDDAKKALADLDQALADKERAAMETLNYNTYRTQATIVAKRLIITGNALMYHPPAGTKVQSYSLRDYVVVRDLSGEIIEIITRDCKSFETLSQEVRDTLRSVDKHKYKKDACMITIYTCIKLDETDGRFAVTQAADTIALGNDEPIKYTKEELPWMPLTWNLLRGEDYGRGLVEDYAGSFHALEVLSEALIAIVGTAADIKWLVKPTSVLDVGVLNGSASGSYHSGEEGDVTAVQLNKSTDIQLVEQAVARLEQQLGQAFLLNSSATRQAERVTAEEIRFVAQELETSHGGIYSHLAMEWQLRTAIIILKDVNVKVTDSSTILPQIITGLDSLSRAGDLDNWRMFVSDLSLLNSVPEEVRAAIDPVRLAAYLGVRRGIEYAGFTKSTQQMLQEQKTKMQQEQQQMQAQGAADASSGIAQTAAKSAMENA